MSNDFNMTPFLLTWINRWSHLNPHEEPGQMSGVWFFAHQQNKPLMTYTSRMMQQPGHFHDIPLKTEIRTHLPPPHGNCQTFFKLYIDDISHRICDWILSNNSWTVGCNKKYAQRVN